MENIIGIGAGGHCKVLLDAIDSSGRFKVVGLTDARKELTGTQVGDVEVLGTDDIIPELFGKGIKSVFIGVGGTEDNSLRSDLFNKAKSLGFEIINVIHPTAIISKGSSLGEGVQVLAGSIINTGASIADNVIINTGAIVEHDCRISNSVHVCPGVRIAGEVSIHEDCIIGIGSTLIQGINIGRGSLIAAGSVVIGDVSEGSKVAGCPAKAIGKTEGA